MFIGSQEIRIVFPSDLHLFHVVRYGFLTLPVGNLDMDSIYLGTPEFDYLEQKDLLKHRGALRFAELRRQSVPDDVSRYLSCIHDEGSAISNPCFQGRHEFLPRRLRRPRAFLCSRKNFTPNSDWLKGILKRDGENVYLVVKER